MDGAFYGIIRGEMEAMITSGRAESLDKENEGDLTSPPELPDTKQDTPAPEKGRNEDE